MSSLNRRQFLKMMGAAGLATFASGIPAFTLARQELSGSFNWWRVPPDTQLEQEQQDAFDAAVAELMPNVSISYEVMGYGEMLDVLRTAVRGGGGPDVAVLPILWGVEFSAGGFLRPLAPADLGYTNEQFWPRALNSNLWDGQYYGVPTNNETMTFIWNKSTFEAAGLDPEVPPKTWDEVVAFSNQIASNTESSGYGIVARQNHGNTPFRNMPLLWAYGASVLDETEDVPQYTEARINSPEAAAALQVLHDIYVRDKSAPSSALDNSQTENRDLFIAGRVAMMIDHPTALRLITEQNPDLAPQVGFAQFPEGPTRRAAVFGGSNIHVFNRANEESLPAILAFAQLRCNPEWANRLAWFSNPGNREGFENEWFQTRMEQIPFLDVATSMLEYGIPFPVIPESTEIMNLIVPSLIQNVLTDTMSIPDALAEAERAINEVLARA
ncbi:MAG: sugar ABC transporter substrate-binding protein [Chloroflexi bacterium]|nr:sugar ABC transporter substrate-binding protein [Chloroflexota bacterium]